MIYVSIYLRRAMLRRSRSHGRRWAGKRSAGGLATRASAASLALTARSARRRPSRWPTCSSESGQMWLRGKQGDEAAERHAPHYTLREVVSRSTPEATAGRVAYTNAPSPRYRGRCREHGREGGGGSVLSVCLLDWAFGPDRETRLPSLRVSLSC